MDKTQLTLLIKWIKKKSPDIKIDRKMTHEEIISTSMYNLGMRDIINKLDLLVQGKVKINFNELED